MLVLSFGRVVGKHWKVRFFSCIILIVFLSAGTASVSDLRQCEGDCPECCSPPNKNESWTKQCPVSWVLKFLSSCKLSVQKHLPIRRAGRFGSFSYQFSERSEDIWKELTLLRNLLYSWLSFQQVFPLDLNAHTGFETQLSCRPTRKQSSWNSKLTKTLYLAFLPWCLGEISSELNCFAFQRFTRLLKQSISRKRETEFNC